MCLEACLEEEVVAQDRDSEALESELWGQSSS